MRNFLRIKRLLLSFIALLGTDATASEIAGIKGDDLGMTLEAYRLKYDRAIKGDSRRAPFCSDTQPGKAMATLLTEEWFAAAGLVNCSTHFPFESHDGVDPTIAGEKADIFIHHFVEARLYKLTVVFSEISYGKVRAAFVSQYGPPTTCSSEPVQNKMGATFPSERCVWSSSLARLSILQRAGTASRASRIGLRAS